jgi:hypothetical protein
MDKETLRFIDKLYRDLYKSEQVLHHSSGNETDKFRNLEEYFETLERVHEKASKSEERIKTLKRMYYSKYIIKPEDIPDSYYDLQKKIALERGYGYIEITTSQKEELQDEVIENQKTSMDAWLDYFLSEDSKFYPFWLKYWAFQGMLKLGLYDKEKGSFNKRTADTVAPFPDLNREALSKSMDLIIKLLNKEKIEDRALEIIVKSGSFQKIYPYVLKNVLSNNSNIIKKNEGVWVKYDRGSDHMPLVKSLQGYNTGWCTAGENTAESQLSCGDFYVYYTLDEKGEYKVPRIAIRMEANSIGEIRGIGKNQNIEPDMEKVVEEKIKDFPDKDKYYKKVEDMKKLTELYKKYENNQELTLEELRFLYEIDDEIIGFGYEKDPRIEEIIKGRNIKHDLSKIFDCSESQISLKGEKYNSDTVYYYGSLDLSRITTPEGLTLPQSIRGDLYLSGLTTAEGLILPQSIRGDLYLSGLTTVEGLILPQSIGGDLDLSSLTTVEGLILPQSIGGDLDLRDLTTAEGLTLPQSIGGGLYLDSLTTAEGLTLPKNIRGSLDLSSLTTAKGLTLPQSIGEDLYLSGLTTAEGLTLPKNIRGSLDLSGLTTAEGLTFPQSIGEDLYLNSLTTAKGLTFPQSIGEDFYLSSLTTAEGLILPQNIGGFLDLSGLTTAEGLTFPQRIGGFLDLRSLTTAEGLTFPQSIGEDLYLRSLTTAKGLTFPQRIGGFLDLRSLTTAEGLTFPQRIGADLYLNSLITAEGLAFPQSIGGCLYLGSSISVDGLTIPTKYRRI